MFETLKNYFENASSCPRNVKRLIEDESSVFWLKFVEAQLVISNRFVLKTESRGTAAFEVASDLSELREIIDRRKDDNFIPFEARATFDKLSAFKQVELREDVKSFYTCLSAYLEKWSKSLDGNEIFEWMKLGKTFDFEIDVVPAAKYLIGHHGAADLDMDGLFDEFPLLQQYVDGNLIKWSVSKTSTEDHWPELLKSLSNQHRAVPNFSILAQYALAIPGSSTEVERLFSIIKNIWGPDKVQMSHKSLEAHLDIKFNSNQTCHEFFIECRSNKTLLAQVQKTGNSSRTYTEDKLFVNDEKLIEYTDYDCT